MCINHFNPEQKFSRTKTCNLHAFAHRSDDFRSNDYLGECHLRTVLPISSVTLLVALVRHKYNLKYTLGKPLSEVLA